MLFENNLVFKCPTHRIVEFFNRHISNIHLDVGVGTGYFLDNCKIPGDDPIIHLMDLNKNSLQKTSRRLKRYRPVMHQWNILEPITIQLPKFTSVSISNILHCLPGTMNMKETVFINLKKFLAKNGTLFGLTILGKGVEAGLLYNMFNTFYNWRRIFTNYNDDAQSLEEILKNNFSHYTLEVVGSVALFSCSL